MKKLTNMFLIRILIFLLTTTFLHSQENNVESIIPSKSVILKLTKKASIYLYESNYEKSFIISRLTLHYAKRLNDNLLIAKSYNMIGANYNQLSEFDKSIYYFKKGLYYAKLAKNDTVKSCIDNNLGNVYCFQKRDLQKGINYLMSSLEFSEKCKDTSNIILGKLNITWAYFDVKQYKNGKPYLDYINKYSPKYGGKYDSGILYMLNGMYYGNAKDYEKANSFFEKAINFCKIKNNSNEEDLSFVLSEYSNYLFSKGEYKNAYENLKTYNKLVEKINNSIKIKRSKIAGENIELDEYKRKVDIITAEKDLQYQSLKKSKIISILFILLTCILLLLIYFLYKNYRFKKKMNMELASTNEALIVAKEKSDETSLLKSQFVSTISHELRTPLYGIIGLTNLIIDENQELAKNSHLDSLKFSARYLLSLINDVLQINKIEENRIVLENMTFNLPDEIQLIINSLSFISKNHNNNLNVELDPEIPEYLIGDKLRLSQILINLISNALKFTKNGDVIVFARVVKVEKLNYYIEFKIIDTGLGIAAEDQSKIFDNFIQVSRKEIDYQGTGLGLPIVKKLLELFNSKIHLESELGKGSTFTFTIPFESNVQRTQEIINNIEVDLTAGQIFKVLVVDDNNINRLITQKTIERNHYNCSAVGSGQEAIDLLSSEKFDIILMDINMPEMNGFEATKRIRKLEINTPIIALTAFSKEDIIEEALSAGINDIIIKPFESYILFKSINQLIYKGEIDYKQDL